MKTTAKQQAIKDIKAQLCPYSSSHKEFDRLYITSSNMQMVKNLQEIPLNVIYIS